MDEFERLVPTQLVLSSDLLDEHVVQLADIEQRIAWGNWGGARRQCGAIPPNITSVGC